MDPIGFNLTRAKEIMARHQLDVIIVTTPVNVFYFSGMPLLPSAVNPILFELNNGYPHIVLLHKSGEATLIRWGLFLSADKFSWITDHKGIMNVSDATRNLTKALKKWTVDTGTIGLESVAPWYVTKAVQEKYPTAKLVIADQAITEIRMIKSTEEIKRIQKATDIAEHAIQTCVNASRVGITDLELIKIGRQAMMDAGGDGWNHFTMNLGNSDPEAPGFGYTMKPHEIARFDFGAVYQGYVSDVSRQVVVGDPPALAREAINRMINVQEWVELRVKPGVNMKQLGDDAQKYYLSLQSGAGFAFVTGHSLGLQVEEVHLFGPTSALDMPFQENMVFEIEVWEKFEGALVGVEDCYQVTATGLHRMTKLDKHIFVK